MKKNVAPAPLFAFLFFLISPNVEAQTPLSDEFQISNLADAADASVVIDDLGRFTVVWSGAGDGSESGVLARRFASDGSTLGDEFVVNSYTTGEQADPEIAIRDTGEFVVAWTMYQILYPGKIIGIRTFDSDGLAVGPQTDTELSFHGSVTPALDVDEDGDFVLIWQEQFLPPATVGRRYDSSGTRLGAQFETGARAYQSAVAVHEDGSFVVAMYGDSFAGDYQFGIFAAQGGSDGVIGAPFQVNSVTTSNPSQNLRPQISMDANGAFIIVWDSEVSGSREILGRRYDSAGVVVGDEFQINTATSGDQIAPDVAVAESGGFVVVWESPIGTEGTEIRGRLFDVFGAPFGDEFAVNSYTTDDQGDSRVDLRGGEFVVTWTSSGLGIRGRRFAKTPIFADGFESGDTSAWSM